MNQAEKDYRKLHTLSRHSSTLEGISSLLSWDRETMMPKGANKIRAEQMETMAKLIHKEKVSKKFASALDKLISIESGEIKAADLSPREVAALKCWRRDYLIDTALPTSFVANFAKVTSEASLVWEEAKERSDFSLFSPYLKQLITLCRKKADYLGYSDTPYDALLDLYEPGMTTRQVDTLFAEIKKPLSALLKQVLEAKQVDDRFLFGNFSHQKQMTFGKSILEGMGYSDEHGRVDFSSHPFSSSYHPTDSRITTRIDSDGLMNNILILLHEGGHSLYAMGLPEEHYGSPLGSAISYGIHESQSRWWETRIGLTKAFWKHYLPELKKSFPKQLESVSLNAFWRGINKVSTSLIRVKADELTYPLHILLRFELEKALINGTMEVDEIPQKWNELTGQLLQITPKNDQEGCLQDIHWSFGGFGYFPTYSLGNMYAAQLFETFEKKYPDWEERVSRGSLAFVNEWLRQAVWRYGREYDGQALIKKITGKAFSAKPYLRYLTDKYSNIYHL